MLSGRVPREVCLFLNFYVDSWLRLALPRGDMEGESPPTRSNGFDYLSERRMVPMQDLAATCQEIKQQLSQYLDGELDPAVCAELERHLHGCDNCRVLVDTLNKTILLYRDYGRAPAPNGIHERLIRVLKLDKTHA